MRLAEIIKGLRQSLGRIFRSWSERLLLEPPPEEEEPEADLYFDPQAPAHWLARVRKAKVQFRSWSASEGFKSLPPPPEAPVRGREVITVERTVERRVLIERAQGALTVSTDSSSKRSERAEAPRIRAVRLVTRGEPAPSRKQKSEPPPPGGTEKYAPRDEPPPALAASSFFATPRAPQFPLPGNIDGLFVRESSATEEQEIFEQRSVAKFEESIPAPAPQRRTEPSVALPQRAAPVFPETPEFSARRREPAESHPGPSRTELPRFEPFSAPSPRLQGEARKAEAPARHPLSSRTETQRGLKLTVREERRPRQLETPAPRIETRRSMEPPASEYRITPDRSHEHQAPDGRTAEYRAKEDWPELMERAEVSEPGLADLLRCRERAASLLREQRGDSWNE
jgi:hypothetical protein